MLSFAASFANLWWNLVLVLLVLFLGSRASKGADKLTSRYDTAGNSASRCRCFPGDPCWPTDEQWNVLNTTLHGRLVVPRPTAYPCYGGPGFNDSECRQIQNQYNKAHFLVDKPGSMHFFNWEDLDDKRCTLEGSKDWDTVCHSGRIPAYTVNAHTASDIQEALRFATQHNLRVVIKSTGHDYLGRSTGPGALMIWLHNFEGETETNGSFTPSGCDSHYRFDGPVVTVPAGKTWDEVYKNVDERYNKRYTVLGGYCYDIGASGGFVLGGGISILSPSFGMAVDNVLEMTLITADSESLTANACQNKDLFWALRGGGGTFGIVTSITYKLHPVPKGYTVYSILVFGKNNSKELNAGQMEDVLEVLSRRTVELDSVGWGAFLFYSPVFGFSIMFIIPTHRLVSLDPMVALKDELVGLQERAGIRVGPVPSARAYLRNFDSFDEWRTWADTTGIYDSFYPGFRSAVGTRLIPASALSPSRHTAQTIVSAAVKNNLTNGFLCLVVVGNATRSNDPESLETSITPAWRKAGWDCLLFSGWDAMTSEGEIAKKKSQLNLGLQVWRDAYPDAGVYYNEAFPDEPNWQEAFWGKNYPLLLEVKNNVDPNGLFVCHKCVGSEHWDATGNCRS